MSYIFGRETIISMKRSNQALYQPVLKNLNIVSFESVRTNSTQIKDITTKTSPYVTLTNNYSLFEPFRRE